MSEGNSRDLVRSVLSLEEHELDEAWWLDASYRGGVASRTGWKDEGVYWYCVLFLDGSRGPVTYGTQND